MISKDELNEIIEKHGHESAFDLYYLILVNNSDLHFPERYFQSLKNKLLIGSECDLEKFSAYYHYDGFCTRVKDSQAEFDILIALLKLRIHRGIDLPSDYCDPILFHEPSVFHAKCQSNVDYHDLSVQACIEQIRRYLSVFDTQLPYPIEYIISVKKREFLWSIAHLNISASDFFREFTSIYSNMNWFNRCVHFEFYHDLKYRFPKLDSPELKQKIISLCHNHFYEITAPPPRLLYFSLLSVDISNFSGNQLQNHIQELIHLWVNSENKMDFPTNKNELLEYLDRFSDSIHWKMVYQNALRVTEKVILDCFSIKSDHVNSPIEQLCFLIHYLVLKGVHKDDLLLWGASFLSKMREINEVKTNEILESNQTMKNALEVTGYPFIQNYFKKCFRSTLFQSAENFSHEIWYRRSDLPVGILMYSIVTDERKTGLLIERYESFGLETHLILHPDELYKLLVIMGEDAFIILHQFQNAASIADFESFVKQINMPLEAIEPLKKLFDKHRDAILNHGKWVEFSFILMAARVKDLSDFLEHLENFEQTHFCMRLLASLYPPINQKFQSLPSTSFDEVLSQFMTKFIQMDSQVVNRERHARDYANTIEEFRVQIAGLSLVFGVDTFSILATFLTTSVLPLERVLSQLPDGKGMGVIFPTMRKYYVKHKVELIRQKNYAQFFEGFPLFLSMIKFGQLDRLVSIIEQSNAVSETNLAIADHLITHYLQAIGQPDEKIDSKKAFEAVPLSAFAKLITVRNSLEKERSLYLKVMDYFLCSDLKGKPLENKKASDIFRMIETHNQAIQRELLDKSIDISKSFAYSE